VEVTVPLCHPTAALGAVARALVLTVLPHGGQLAARRNAWAAMAADAAHARASREAQAALELAAVAHRRAVPGGS
jgi:hypothetical protein